MYFVPGDSKNLDSALQMDYGLDFGLDNRLNNNTTKIFNWQGSKVTNYSNPICSNDTYLQYIANVEVKVLRWILQSLVVNGLKHLSLD